MPRPQFNLKTLLWLTLVVAAFFAGATWQRQRDIRATEAALEASETAIYLDEAKLMKGWHQLKLGMQSLAESRESLIEMGRKQAEKERDDARIRSTLERLRPSPELPATQE